MAGVSGWVVGVMGADGEEVEQRPSHTLPSRCQHYTPHNKSQLFTESLNHFRDSSVFLSVERGLHS